MEKRRARQRGEVREIERRRKKKREEEREMDAEEVDREGQERKWGRREYREVEAREGERRGEAASLMEGWQGPNSFSAYKHPLPSPTAPCISFY